VDKFVLKCTYQRHCAGFLFIWKQVQNILPWKQQLSGGWTVNWLQHGFLPSFWGGQELSFAGHTHTFDLNEALTDGIFFVFFCKNCVLFTFLALGDNPSMRVSARLEPSKV
jgi:hypothetical protein